MRARSLKFKVTLFLTIALSAAMGTKLEEVDGGLKLMLD